MKLSRKLALVVLPLAAVLAGCQTTGTSKTDGQATAQTQQQGASVEVFAASDRQVQGFRPVRISDKQVIYVAQNPVLTREHLTVIEPIQDNQGRHFVRLGLNAAGAQALTTVPKNQGYVTVIGGQVASLSGVAQGTNFMFLTRDAQTAQAIVGAVAGGQ